MTMHHLLLNSENRTPSQQAQLTKLKRTGAFITATCLFTIGWGSMMHYTVTENHAYQAAFFAFTLAAAYVLKKTK